jgi:hypothetical protein
MKCPYCGHVNEWSDDQCQMCRRDVAHLRERVFLGNQFTFFEASPEQPIRVRLTPVGTEEGEDQRFTQPTIISRHEYAVRLERDPSRSTPQPEPKEEPRLSLPGIYRDSRKPFDMPALEFPPLNLAVVTTDRQVYRRQDEVHIFLAAPGAAGQEAELQVELADQPVYQARVTLDQAGLGLAQLADLEEGEYTARMTFPGQPAMQASCSFICAEFIPSALALTVESHTLEGQHLTCVLKVTQFGDPYTGSLDLAVDNGGHAVYQGQAQASAGRLEADLKLEPLTFGDVTIEATTPQGHAAAAVCRRLIWEDWDRVTLSPLDPPVKAALIPVHGVQGEMRGLHYARGDEEHSLFSLESVVGLEGRIVARRKADLVHLLVFDPLTGEHQKLEFQAVEAGDVLRFHVASPYTIFTLGAFMGRALPYEAWGVVLRPVDLRASLDAPPEAAPGAIISVRVETDGPASCLLLVYDARLEGGDFLMPLARCMSEHIFKTTWKLEARHVAQVAWLMQAGLLALTWRSSLQSQGRPLKTWMRQSYEETQKLAMRRTFLVAPGQTIPELAHIELFPLDGPRELLVQLGDQAAAWRCRAYFFRGYDWVSVTRDVQVGR